MDGDSFETWLNDHLEMEEDPCTFFPEEKMSSPSSSSLEVEITANQRGIIDDHHQLADQKPYHQPETNSLIPFSSSEASLTFSYVDGNHHHHHQDIAILGKPARKNCINWIEFDADMNNGQSGDKWRSKKTPLPLPHHIVVERQRRQDINQRFLALSKVVPGNKKKKDKASILGEAVKHMKDLQERIKTLEEKNKKEVVESVVFVKRSSSSSPSSSNQYLSHYRNNINNSYRGSILQLPEIEAKVIERSVLIRVHCGNHRAILPTLLSAVSKLHLIVLTSNAVPFGNDTDITVIAEMGVDFRMKMKDVVKYLRLALSSFI